MRVLVLLMLGLGLTVAAFRSQSTTTETKACRSATEIATAGVPADANVFSQILIQSSDGGSTWQDIRPMLPHPLNIRRMMADQGELFVALDKDGLFRSEAPEKGKWQQEIGSQFFKERQVLNIFPGRFGHYVTTTGEAGLYRKIPSTEMWQTMHDSLQHRFIGGVLELENGAILVSSERDIVKTMDDGKTWKRVIVRNGITQLVASGNAIFASCTDGILRSTDGGEHWKLVLNDEADDFKTIALQDGIAAIRIGDSWSNIGQGEGLRISKDGGDTWKTIDIGQMMPKVTDIRQAGKYLFCAHNEGISRSADGGKNWELVYPYTLQNQQEFLNLQVSGNTIYAILMRGGC